MNRRFVIAIVALLVFFVLVDYRMPRHFVWEPTFGHQDTQPFGAALLDSALAVSLPEGYTVTRQTLWQLQHDSAFMACPHGIVVLTTNLNPYEAERRQAMTLAEQGHTLLVAAGNNALGLEDTLDLSIFWHEHFDIGQASGFTPDYDTLVWTGPPGDSLTVSMMSNMLEWGMHTSDTLPCEPLVAELAGTTCHAVSYAVGKGEIIVVSSPLLFTNYGLLHEQERLLIGRLMVRMSHLPVVRTTAYVRSSAFTEQSPLYVLLQRPPLRWAVYLAMTGILLFMFTTARRRQRVIPVMTPPRNGNLEFVRLVGTLFYQQGDHRGLVERKLTYAAEEIRRLTGIDISEERLQAGQLARLARLTGLSPDELRLRIANAREATTGHHVVTPEEMRVHIDNLNDMVERIS